MLEKIINSKSKTFLTLCFSFLLGIISVSLLEWKIDFVYLYLALFILVTFLIIFWKEKGKRFLIFCFLVFLIGVGRYLIAFPFSEIEIGKQDIVGYVSAEPDVRMDGVRYIIKIKNTHNKIQDNLIGKNVYVKTLL
ncbi:MAG: DUF4131 domain-containing protein, partial [Candidatus Magasanikiibacteriota bacterium]